MKNQVTPVRTKDDVLITVKLLIFYELRDIQTMLDKTRKFFFSLSILHQMVANQLERRSNC